MAGRPKRESLEDIENLKERIDAFFKHCDENDNGHYTITGLAMWLDCTSKDTLYKYINKVHTNIDPETQDQISELVKSAKQKVENCYERHLFDSQVAGKIFALKNFGWQDKVINENINKTVTVDVEEE
jgi:hypothetical protein